MIGRYSAIWIRWLFFLVLSFLVLYTYNGSMPQLSELWLKVGLLVFYAISNTLLMWATRANFKLERWSMPIFVADVDPCVQSRLYFSAGADTELYLLCFLIIYLSTLRPPRAPCHSAHARSPRFFMDLLLTASKSEHQFLGSSAALAISILPSACHCLRLILSEQTPISSKNDIGQMKEVQTGAGRRIAERRWSILRDKQSALVQAEKTDSDGAYGWRFSARDPQPFERDCRIRQ